MLEIDMNYMTKRNEVISCLLHKVVGDAASCAVYVTSNGRMTVNSELVRI